MIIKDKTPMKFKCIVGACPCFYETDKDTYVLVGVQLGKAQIKKLGLESRVGSNEAVIEIPKDLIKNV